ncbi:MAG: glycosyltransferase, partial [Xanthomonadales bacterium]|nr:glycosyltransferase [Xanthomonadales bacterium]
MAEDLTAGPTHMTSQLKWFVLLFGDIDFDGRAGRMIDIAQAFGEVHLLDCAVAAPQNRFRSYGYDRCRVAPGTSQPRRHLAFLRQALATARRMRPDVVLAEDFFTAMPGRLAAAISGARFIYDAHELIIPGKDEATSYRDRFWAALERHAAPAADLVIAANSERAQIMTDSYPLRRPASYMRNIPDVQPPSEASLAEVRTKYPTLERRTTDEILVLYQGAIVAARGLPRFMDAVAHLPANYRLIVAGDGPDRQILTALAAGDRFGGRINFLGKVL